MIRKNDCMDNDETLEIELRWPWIRSFWEFCLLNVYNALKFPTAILLSSESLAVPSLIQTHKNQISCTLKTQKFGIFVICKIVWLIEEDSMPLSNPR